MRIKVIPLGTSSGVPTRARNVSALALDFGPRWILLDCGEGTQYRLIHSELKSKLRRARLDAILISHLHGDHLFGLPGLLAAMSLRDQRKHPLMLIGPTGIRQWIETTLRIAVTHLTFELEIREIGRELMPGEPCLIRDGTVRTLPLEHRISAFGYRIETRPRGPKPPLRIAYCTDTKPCENSVELGRDADLLIHESTYTSALTQKAHDRGHSTAREAAEIALRAGAKKLMITHFSPRYPTPDSLLADARAIFPETIAARDMAETIIQHPRSERMPTAQEALLPENSRRARRGHLDYADRDDSLESIESGDSAGSRSKSAA